MSRSSRVAVTVGAVVAVVLVAVLVWWSASRDADRPAAGATSTASSTLGPDDDGAAGTDPDAATAAPTSGTDGPATPAPDPDGTDGGSTGGGGTDGGTGGGGTDGGGAPAPASTDVVVTYSGWNATSGAVEVGAYVPVLESGGTCTLVLTQGTTVVEVARDAAPDASTTACGALAVERAALAPGSWQAVVRYLSPSSAGESAPVTVEVP